MRIVAPRVVIAMHEGNRTYTRLTCRWLTGRLLVTALLLAAAISTIAAVPMPILGRRRMRMTAGAVFRRTVSWRRMSFRGRLAALTMGAPIGRRNRHPDQLLDVAQERRLLGIA